MKRIIFSVFLAIIFFFPACKKDSSDTSPLTGSWELRSKWGGFAPTVSYPAGNGQIFAFTETTYSQYDGGQLLKTGTYQLVIDSIKVGDPTAAFVFQKIHRIIYDNDPTKRSLLKITDSTIIYDVTASTSDGIEKKYVKL